MKACGRTVSPAFTQCGVRSKTGGDTHVTHGPRRLAALERVRAGLLVLAATPADLIRCKTGRRSVDCSWDPAGRADRATGTYYVGRARLCLAIPFSRALVRTCHAFEYTCNRTNHATLSCIIRQL